MCLMLPLNPVIRNTAFCTLKPNMYPIGHCLKSHLTKFDDSVSRAKTVTQF